jgi:hypothetical protein
MQPGFHPYATDGGYAPHHPPTTPKSSKAARGRRNSSSSRSDKHAIQQYGSETGRTSGRVSVASAKGEGLMKGNESSEGICVGTSSTGGESPAIAERDQGKKAKTAASAKLLKGQTAAISQVLTAKAEPEEVAPPPGGFFRQFWGANRQVKTKKALPRAPTITAPVIESQKGDRVGVRLGCW